MKWFAKLALAFCLLVPLTAQAQTVQQSGSVTAGHAAKFCANGVICDAGTAAAGTLTSLGVTASGLGICQRSAATGAFNRICIGATSSGGTIDLTNVGGATGGLSFSINGVAQGLASVTLPVIVDDFACWATTGGQLKDCGALPNIAIANHAVAIGTGIIGFRAASPIVGGVLASVDASTDPAFSQTPTLGASGTLGSLTMGNATSGFLTLRPVTGALGTVTVSLPAATDTLVGKATTDTFTNKTYDTAGTGNSFLINGLAVTASTGTGSMVRATSPSIAGLTVTGSFTATGLVQNASLANPATTVNGQTCTLGSTCTVTAAASSLVVGTTTITSGTTTNILYNNAGTLGEYTVSGTGTVVCLATSCVMTTPSLGIATATSINKVAITAPATSATLTIADGKTVTHNATTTFAGTDGKTLTLSNSGTLSGGDAFVLAIAAGKTLTVSASLTLAGTDAKTLTISNSGTLSGGDAFVLAIAAAKTLTVSNTLTFTGTDGTSFAFPGTSDTVVGLAAAQTLTNKTLTTPTINGGVLTALTGLAIRSTGSAFDLTFANTEVLTAGRTLTITLNNAARALNISGDVTTAAAFTTAGANALTLTTTGTTNVTLPTTGTLVNSAVTTLSSLVSIGTITTGTWQGTAVALGFGGSGQATAATARGCSGFNIDCVTTFGNAAYTVLVTDRTVATTVTFSAPRTVTLPTVASFTAGQQVTIIDSFGAINGANTMTIAANAADSINGTSSITISTQYGGAVLWPIGSNKWGYIAASAGGGSGTVTTVQCGNVTISVSGTCITDPGMGYQNCSIAASVGSSLLTIALKDNAGSDPTSTSPCTIPFRSATAATGTVTVRYVTAATSINTNATGATLGSANSTAFRFWVVAFDNAGTIVLALINASSSTQCFPINETLVQTSTAISGSATAAGVYYTPNGTTVTAKSIRILGYVEYGATGLTTAGTYASAPTFAQMAGFGTKKPCDTVQRVSGGTASATTVTSSTYTTTGTTAAIALTSAANRVRYTYGGMFKTTTAVSNFGASRMYRDIGGGGFAAISATWYSQVIPGSGSTWLPISTTPQFDAPNSLSTLTYTVYIFSSDNTTSVLFPAAAVTGETSVVVLEEIMG